MLSIVESTMSFSCPVKADNMLNEKNREKTEDKARYLHKSENSIPGMEQKYQYDINDYLYKPFRIELKSSPVAHCQLIRENLLLTHWKANLSLNYTNCHIMLPFYPEEIS